MESHPLFDGEQTLPGVWTFLSQDAWTAASRAERPGHNCDRFEVIQDGDRLYVAIMDGAGPNSREAVDLVAERLSSVICARPVAEVETDEEFSRIFCALDMLVESEGDSSLTLTLALLRPGHLDIAYVGDSEAFLLRGVERRSITPLTTPHHTDHPREEQRLLDEGATVEKGRLIVKEGGVRHAITLTRAIGGRRFGSALSYRPGVLRRSIRLEDQFLLLTTDGVAEMLGESRSFREGVCALPASTTADGIVRHLFADLERRGPLSDDATVIVIDLTSFRSRTG